MQQSFFGEGKLDLSSIPISQVLRLIPSLLHRKFSILGLKTLQDIVDFDEATLGKYQGLGTKNIYSFKQLRAQLLSDPSPFLDYPQGPARITRIPQEVNVPFIFLTTFAGAALQFVRHTSRPVEVDVILHYYGLESTTESTLQEIAHYNRLSPERVRQLHVQIIKDLQRLFMGSGSAEIVHPLLLDELRRIIASLRERAPMTLTEFYELCETPSKSLDIKAAALLFLDVAGFSITPKSYSKRTNATFIAKNDVSQRALSNVCNDILNALDGTDTPLSLRAITTAVRKAEGRIEEATVNRLLTILPEVEEVLLENGVGFRLRFEALPSVNDMAFRLLSETGSGMHVDQIISTANTRLVQAGNHRMYDKASMHLSNDNRFSPRGRTGYWDLSHWETNRDSLDELIRKTMYTHNRPLSHAELYEAVQLVRPEVKRRSLTARASIVCLSSVDGKLLMPEWKSIYPNLQLRAKSKPARAKIPGQMDALQQDVIAYLKLSPLATDRLNDTVRYFAARGVKRPTLYKVLSDKRFFSKTNGADGMYIGLHQAVTKAIPKSPEYEKWQVLWPHFDREYHPRFGELFPSASFTDVFAVLYQVLVQSTPFEGLNGVFERFVENVSNVHHGAVTRIDRLNAIKQLLSLLDPFLKKVLWNVDPKGYAEAVAANKGLGGILDRLALIDPRKVRYAKPTDQLLLGPEEMVIKDVYGARNIDIHNAPPWTEVQIMTKLSDCILFYLLVVVRYRTPLEQRLK